MIKILESEKIVNLAKKKEAELVSKGLAVYVKIPAPCFKHK